MLLKQVWKVRIPHEKPVISRSISVVVSGLAVLAGVEKMVVQEMDMEVTQLLLRVAVTAPLTLPVLAVWTFL